MPIFVLSEISRRLMLRISRCWRSQLPNEPPSPCSHGLEPAAWSSSKGWSRRPRIVLLGPESSRLGVRSEREARRVFGRLRTRADCIGEAPGSEARRVRRAVSALALAGEQLGLAAKRQQELRIGSDRPQVGLPE